MTVRSTGVLNMMDGFDRARRLCDAGAARSDLPDGEEVRVEGWKRSHANTMFFTRRAIHPLAPSRRQSRTPGFPMAAFACLAERDDPFHLVQSQACTPQVVITGTEPGLRPAW